MQFVFGIRIVALLSLLLGLLLLGISGWTLHEFVNGEIGSPSTMQRLQHKTKRSNSDAEPITSGIDDINEKIKELKRQWKEFKPFLVGSGGAAIAAGFIQAITSLLILCTGPKGARSRSGCFKCTHFILLVLLFVALLVPAIFDVQHDSLTHRIQDIFHRIQEEIKNTKLDENFSPNVVTLYYGVIAVDIVGVVVLILSTCCLMRDADYDYRAY